MGCQTGIAQTIVEEEADYELALKNSLKTWKAANIRPTPITTRKRSTKDMAELKSVSAGRFQTHKSYAIYAVLRIGKSYSRFLASALNVGLATKRLVKTVFILPAFSVRNESWQQSALIGVSKTAALDAGYGF
jgi:hypothetical protein